MRNRNQTLGALAQRLPAQLRHTVLGDDIVDVTAAGRDRRAGCQRRHNLGCRLILGGRVQCDNRTAALGQVRAAHKVHLSADARDLPQTDCFRTHLSLQVHLNARVDGHNVVILRDDGWIVAHIHRQHPDHRIVIHIIIQPACAHQKGDTHLFYIALLALAVDHTAFQQRQYTVGDHLGVQSEVFFLPEKRAHRIGQRTDT